MHPLHPEALCAAARDETGLEDFGDPSFRPALEALSHSLVTEAGLSDFGADLLRQKLTAQLANRLRVEQAFKDHPQIEQETLAPPLFIVGFPRTGTTKLHRLLACDPRFRWMAFWESQFPVPFPGEQPGLPEARRATGAGLVQMMVSGMPKLAAIHPMDNDAADEEVMLMEHAFLSAFNAYADVPGYMAWLDAADQRPAYRYLARMLRFLQWQQRQRGLNGQRWVLKAPHHLLRMHLILECFPGAQVVLTHRDPVQSMPSLASFIHTLRQLYSPQADAARAGREWTGIMSRAQRHTLAVRAGTPQAFFDVDFRHTVSQPLAVVESLYAWLGLTLPADVRQRMAAWLEADARSHAGGAHRYTAEEYGLSADGIREAFADYLAAHPVH